MKSEVEKIRKDPFTTRWMPGGSFKLTKSDFLWTVAPALLWVALILMRQSVIVPGCVDVPEKCSKASLLPVDQLSFGMEDPKADEYSYFTQNLSGALAAGIPAMWGFSKIATGMLSPAAALTTVGVDLVLVLQTTSWNGAFAELSHLLVQRPRPFVYYDPRQRGIDPAHYISFYSGHTSFAAAMGVSVFLILLVRGAPLWLILVSIFSAESLVIATAYFRILAGRHFLTDVVFAAIAGTATAWVVVGRHRSEGRLR